MTCDEEKVTRRVAEAKIAPVPLIHPLVPPYPLSTAKALLKDPS